MRKYFLRIGSAMSQLGNVIFLGGHPNESISGRSHRCKWWSEPWIDAVFGKGHCAAAYQHDANWAQLYLDYTHAKDDHA